jgi:hypothetical protein
MVWAFLLSSRCDTEKGGGKGKGHRIDKQNEVNSCAAWGYLVPHGLQVEDGLYLGVCEYGSWIWTATVIMYEFSVQW